jgi:hypothetical protein
MDALQIYEKECNVSLLKINNLMESVYDTFLIEAKELEMNTSIYHLISESDAEIVYEAQVSDLSKKVVNAITAIMKQIEEYIDKVKREIIENFSEKEKKEKLKVIKENIDKLDSKEKVEIEDDAAKRKLLDEYLRDMLKLERKLVNLKVSYKMRVIRQDGIFIIEANKITDEMNKLNAKFDEDFLNDNKDIIQMASKDAVRFSEKQLDNIRVDYNALEKGSDEILQQFKKDANGCEIPEHLNIIQRMSNSVATRVRRVAAKLTEYRHRNLGKIIALGTVALGITAYMKFPPVKNKVNNSKIGKGAMKIVNDLNEYNKRCEENRKNENKEKVAETAVAVVNAVTK